VCVSYRIVLIFGLLHLRLRRSQRRLRLVPGDLQHATFELCPLVRRLEETNRRTWIRWLWFQSIIFIRLLSVIVFGDAHVLGFAPRLEGHDDAVGVLVSDVFDLAEILRRYKIKMNRCFAAVEFSARGESAPAPRSSPQSAA